MAVAEMQNLGAHSGIALEVLKSLMCMPPGIGKCTDDRKIYFPSVFLEGCWLSPSGKLLQKVKCCPQVHHLLNSRTRTRISCPRGKEASHSKCRWFTGWG
jgi:hypothetical protein